MVEKGYLAAGYNYLVIDDCWSMRERDKDGRLVADPEKFPHGMKAVADYVHKKGLKFGMYSCCGVRTCAGFPSSYEHEFVDAQTFAEWEVDFLKYDFCFRPQSVSGETLYRRMNMALRSTGRDILFSACNWGHDDSGRWMRSAGANMYRSTGDIFDNFKSFTDIFESQIDKLCYGAPNCFNDMDMLVVGMYGKGHVGLGGCTDAEYRSHFALWCLCNSPLMIGGDLRNMSPQCEELLKNPILISMNQDPEARPPFVAFRNDNGIALMRQLAGDEYALGFFNFSEKRINIWCMLGDTGLPLGSGYGLALTDAFTGESADIVTEYAEATVDSHDCAVYRAKLTKL